MKQIPNLTIILFILALILNNASLAASDIGLSGIIQNELGRPVSGAEVHLRLKNFKTITDSSGKFKISSDSSPVISGHSLQFLTSIVLNGYTLTVNLTSVSPLEISIYNIDGSKNCSYKIDISVAGEKKITLPASRLNNGMNLLTICHEGKKSVFRIMFFGENNVYEKSFLIYNSYKKSKLSKSIKITGIAVDTLIVIANGFVPKVHPLNNLVENNIVITLLPYSYGSSTPSYPDITSIGGSGDVTTYGNVHNPEFSKGGACNYGSTKILYYAAINVHQIPGDFKGNWQEGRACGRCARVRALTKDGWRTAIVRIVDKCSDSYCGIDLGGAAARDIMGTASGRYYGNWEWVDCDSVDNVSDGPATLHIKEGSGEDWSIVQVRNGLSGVLKMRARKAESVSSDWTDFNWATEAENFFRVPREILQDKSTWEIEILWDLGSKASVNLPGNALSKANASYPLKF